MINSWLASLFFFLYIVIAVVIGFTASRRETEEGFMLAERKVGSIFLAASMSAGFFDGFALAAYLAYIYQFGLSALWMFIGVGVGFLWLRRFAPRIKARADALRVYSMPEFFFRVFGKRSGLAFSFILVVQFFLLLIVNLIVSGKVLSAIFPLPYGVAAAIGGAIILSYLLLGGFKAVVRTDFFQLCIMVLMSLSVALYLFGRTTIPVSELNLGAMGWSTTLGFLIIGTFNMMVAPDLWQRIFASRDERALRNALTMGAVILIVLAAVISVAGIATKLAFPDIAPEDALVTSFKNLLPFGLREFGLVLLYAVALSSSDTVTFVVSSILTRDLQNYTRRFSEESMRKLTRIFMVFFVLLALSIGLLYQNIIALAFTLTGLTLALFPAVFGSFYWKLSDRAVFWSIVVAVGSLLVPIYFNALTPETVVVTLPVALLSLVVGQYVSHH
ncbi:MAG: sodium:solute symporter family protein, partial [Candidatus Peribacteraceae bacterium]|nr:sodium:solute symporter family protein [Candidatus Peribacteraceae bacterium]